MTVHSGRANYTRVGGSGPRGRLQCTRRQGLRQSPTKAGEPQKFEARAEYVNQGKGWELVPPIGIYPL